MTRFPLRFLALCLLSSRMALAEAPGPGLDEPASQHPLLPGAP
jgi:hypothetical protein